MWARMHCLKRKCRNKSQQIGKGLAGAAVQPNTQKWDFAVYSSPFALEDLRSVLVSHLHDKGGTKSALHPGDHTSLRWGEVLRAKTALQPPVTAARKCCISARCCMVLWAGMLLSDACCLSSLPQTNVNSCSASSASPTRHNLSFLAPCPALPFISQGMKWIPLIQSPQWQ